LDYWPLRRLEWRPGDRFKRFANAWWPLIREKLPLFFLVAPSMVVTYIAQAHEGAVAGPIAAPFSWRLANSLVSYAKYLLLSFWPEGLAIYYPSSYHTAPVWQWAAALILLGAITAVALRKARDRSYLIVGWLWFLGTLVPVIGLVQVGDQAMADRYTYIPSIGLFIALVFGLADLAKAWRIGVPVATATGATILVLASLTTLRLDDGATAKPACIRPVSYFRQMFIQNHLICSESAGKTCRSHSPFHRSAATQTRFFDALANMGLALRRQGQAEADFYKRALG
jgi:hypothetical protein